MVQPGNVDVEKNFSRTAASFGSAFRLHDDLNSKSNSRKIRRGSYATYVKDEELKPDCSVSMERFNNRTEYLFSLIGRAVGPGNVWRFPLLVCRNDGAIFVMLYVLLAVLLAMPLTFMELALGQYSGQDTVHVFDMSPAFRGVGFSMCFLSMTMAVYFHVLMAYFLHYFANCFQHTLPWTQCSDLWGPCFTDYASLRNFTLCSLQSRSGDVCYCNPEEKDPIRHYHVKCTPLPKHAAEYYFQEVARWHNLGPQNGFGVPSAQLTLLLLTSWVLVICCCRKDSEYTSKAVYVMLLFPYLGMFILIIRGSMLDGAGEGLKFVFYSMEFGNIGYMTLWIDALGQSLTGTAVGLGSNFMFGSFSHFHNKTYKDALLVTLVDVLTNVLAALSVFLVMGYEAKRAGFGIPYIVREHFGLIFVAYPSALSELPSSRSNSAIFFLMLYMISFNNEIGNLATVITYLENDFLMVRQHLLVTRIVVGAAGFLLSLVFITPLGTIMIDLLDHIVIGLSVPAICFFELLIVMWIYGFHRFLDDMEYMLNIKMQNRRFWCALFGIVIPAGLLVRTFVHDYEKSSWEFPIWWNFLELVYFPFSLVPIFMWFVFYAGAVYSNQKPHRNCVQFLKKVLRPSERWAPNDGSNVHRNIDNVFADISVSVARQRRRRHQRFPSYSLNFSDLDLQLTAPVVLKNQARGRSHRSRTSEKKRSLSI